MMAKGNGAPSVCVNNLLQIFRGEVPYERVKGLNPRLIDKPQQDAEATIKQEAEWLISTYEPRAEIVGISIASADTPTGFMVTAEIKEKEV